MIERKFFICAGAQKGGTTWLHKNLVSHPELSLPPRKELRYFDAIHFHDFEKLRRQRLRQFALRYNSYVKSVLSGADLQPNAKELEWNFRYAVVDRENYNDDWYESLFNKCDPTKLTGEFSPNYSLLPAEGVQNMLKVAPGAKIVLILRDPVDRLWSGSVYARRSKINGVPTDEDYKEIEVESCKDIQMRFSNYSRVIPIFEDTFGVENVLYLFYDDIYTRPMDVLRRFSEFFELDHKDAWYKSLREPVNEGPKVPRNTALIAKMSERLSDELLWLEEKFPDYGGLWRQKYSPL